MNKAAAPFEKRQLAHDKSMRLDIQTLRAIAIATVVIFHLWPWAMPGGFVGVDIFFVISGYLITGQLWREVKKNGRIDFANFWARRARRLLPASLLVVAVSLLLCVTVIPASLFLKYGWDAAASAFYVQNWALAARATDYLANDGTLSMFQHFWSLSVEEQFYIFWPMIMWVSIWLAAKFLAKRGISGVRALLLVALFSLLVMTLVYSIWATENTKELAYFSTLTRTWEFAAGAILAVLARSDRAHALRRNPLVWYSGLALVVYSLVTFTTKLPFPSFWAAIPVAGAVLMLWGGESLRRPMPTAVFKFGPMHFLGDISYSLYLWHWPLIIVYPWVRMNFDLREQPIDGWVILAVSLLLAWASKRYVEDPVRFGRASRWRPRKQLLAAGAAMLIVLGANSAAVASATSSLSNNWANLNLTPALKDVAKDVPAIEKSDCRVNTESTEFITCEKGNPDGANRIALIGDSHTRQYYSAIEELAKTYDWSLTLISKSACPIQAPELFPQGMSYASCPGWNVQLEKYMTQQAKFDLVITTSSSLVTGFFEQSGPAFTSQIQKLFINRGTQVMVIHDNPKPLENFAACIEKFGPKAAANCDVKRSDALVPVDHPAEAAAGMPGVIYLDLTDKFCSAELCPPVIDGVIVYRDHSHLTNSFALSLKPDIEAALPPQLRQKEGN